jgi:hypothetical protein
VIKLNAEGIWKVEMLGPHGWEEMSTATIQGGRYFAGSANHYGIGSYETDGEDLKADLRVTQHADIRTFFGVKKKSFSIRIEGKFETADRVIAQATLAGDDGAFEPGGTRFQIAVLLTRLDGLD